MMQAEDEQEGACTHAGGCAWCGWCISAAGLNVRNGVKGVPCTTGSRDCARNALCFIAREECKQACICARSSRALVQGAVYGVLCALVHRVREQEDAGTKLVRRLCKGWLVHWCKRKCKRVRVEVHSACRVCTREVSVHAADVSMHSVRVPGVSPCPTPCLCPQSHRCTLCPRCSSASRTRHRWGCRWPSTWSSSSHLMSPTRSGCRSSPMAPPGPRAPSSPRSCSTTPYCAASCTTSSPGSPPGHGQCLKPRVGTAVPTVTLLMGPQPCVPGDADPSRHPQLMHPY